MKKKAWSAKFGVILESATLEVLWVGEAEWLAYREAFDWQHTPQFISKQRMWMTKKGGV